MYCRRFLLFLSVILAAGCSDPTPADYFNKHHSGTTTPHGLVRPGSAVDAADGHVRYQLENGDTFEILPQPDEDGGYRYFNPRQVE